MSTQTPLGLRTIHRTVLRTILGFIIAPALPALVFLAIQTSGDLITKPDPSIIRSRNEWPIVQMSAMLGYTLAVMNLLLYVLFRWRGWNSLWTYLTSGALQGFLIYPVHILIEDHATKFNGSSWSWKTALEFIPRLMICGVAVAFIFWLIVRPDRSCKDEGSVPSP
jgi:hypothetical protein